MCFWSNRLAVSSNLHSYGSRCSWAVQILPREEERRQNATKWHQKVLNIFKNPANVGGLHGANGIGKAVEPTLKDVAKLYIKVNENEIVEEARFKTMGGVISIVSSSVVTELITGKTLEELESITVNDVLEVIGEVEDVKLVNINLAIEALKLAVADYYKKKEKEEKENKKD